MAWIIPKASSASAHSLLHSSFQATEHRDWSQCMSSCDELSSDPEIARKQGLARKGDWPLRQHARTRDGVLWMVHHEIGSLRTLKKQQWLHRLHWEMEVCLSWNSRQKDENTYTRRLSWPSSSTSWVVATYARTIKLMESAVRVIGL